MTRPLWASSPSSSTRRSLSVSFCWESLSPVCPSAEAAEAVVVLCLTSPSERGHWRPAAPAGRAASGGERRTLGAVHRWRSCYDSGFVSCFTISKIVETELIRLSPCEWWSLWCCPEGMRWRSPRRWWGQVTSAGSWWWDWWWEWCRSCLETAGATLVSPHWTNIYLIWQKSSSYD